MFWPGSLGEYRVKPRHATALYRMAAEDKNCGATLYVPSGYQPATTRRRDLQQDDSHVTIALAFRNSDASVLPRLVSNAGMLHDEHIVKTVERINGAADAAGEVAGQIERILDPIIRETPIGDEYRHKDGGSINVRATSWHKMYDGHREQFGQIFGLLDTLQGHQKAYEDGVSDLGNDLCHGLRIMLNRYVRWAQEGFSPWRGRYVTFKRLNHLLAGIDEMKPYRDFLINDETGLGDNVKPKPGHGAQEQLRRLKFDTMCNAAAFGEAPEAVAEEPPEPAPEVQPQDAAAIDGQGGGQVQTGQSPASPGGDTQA